MKNIHYFFFFFNDSATTEIYTLSLHDALPIFKKLFSKSLFLVKIMFLFSLLRSCTMIFLYRFLIHKKLLIPILFFFADRKSTRLNSSHANISYAVFCLKKKK